MKKFAVAAISALVIGTGAAVAADLPLKAPLAVPAPLCTWCGWYVGANAGGGWHDGESVGLLVTPGAVNAALPANGTLSQNAAIAGIPGNLPFNASGFIGGVQGGYNWQFNRIVAGIEADIQGASIKGSANSVASVPLVGFAVNAQTNVTVGNRLDYLGTVRGRLGFTAVPNLLLYGTGGFAYGGVNSNTTVSQMLAGPAVGAAGGLAVANDNFSGTRVGWVAGVGGEWMATQRWSFKLEYLYYDLGNVNYGGTLNNLTTAASGAGPAGSLWYSLGIASSTHMAGNIVRVGVNYHWGSPVVAKY